MGSIPNLSTVKGPNWPLPKLKYLSRLFEDNAAKCPHTTAVIYKGVSNGTVHKLTYTEMDKAANRMARTLLSHIEPSPNSDGDFVIATNLPPSDALLLTLLAIWKCGASYLPLDQHAPSARVQHILKEAKPVLIVTEEEDSERDAVYDGYNAVSFLHLDAEATQMSASVITEKEMLPSTRQPLAVVLYTSGSTGIPKGVRLPHEVVYNRLRWQWREFPYSSTETVCVFKTTLTFVDAVSELWGPLLNPEPRTVLVVPKEITKDPQRLIPLLEEYKVERLLLVPTLLRSILMYLSLAQQKQLMNLKTWVCSGEPLPVSLARQFLNHFSSGFHALCNFYGSTEVMGDITYHVMKSEDDVCVNDKVPIGRPVDNTTIYLLDKQLRPVPLGEVGEIYASGLNLSAGYVNGRDPERYIENPHAVDPDYSRLYRTGDYGRVVKGIILYEGRTDSQVKVRGHRVDLAEIDAALNKIKGVDKTAVLCYRPGEVDQMVIAYITQHEDSSLTGEEIENILRSSLAPYAIPQVLPIDVLPLLNNGKVDRQTLLKRYAEISEGQGDKENVELDYSGVPENKRDAAQCLLKTVASVLAGSVRGKISLQSSFYRLGGNSLNSVYTVTKLHDQGYNIGITDFISAETLMDVLDKMKHEDGEEGNVRRTSTNSQRHYIAEILADKHKTDVFRIITDSFYEKADLEQWIEPRIGREEYVELLTKIWPALVEKELSFIVRSAKTGEIVSVSLNFDAHDEPEVELTGRLNIIFEFLEHLEGPIRDNRLPKGKRKILHTFMMGTDKTLTAAENVSAIQFMEEEALKLGRSRGFVGLFTTNTSPLTQQLGTDIFNYQVFCDYQVNKYVAPDGSRPFRKAPDSQKASCSWKEI